MGVFELTSMYHQKLLVKEQVETKRTKTKPKWFITGYEYKSLLYIYITNIECSIESAETWRVKTA
jgi:hypothetical protein